MYAILSPFSLGSWIVAVFSFFVAGLIMLLSLANFNPFFWIATILLEQNDFASGKINKANIAIVLAWLYAAHILRNVYTSNLYTYITLENPVYFPNSFEEIVNESNITLLASNWAQSVMYRFKDKMDVFRLWTGANRSKLSELVDQALSKQFEVTDLYFSQQEVRIHILYGGIRTTCYFNGKSKALNEKLCEKLNKFAYLTIPGMTVSVAQNIAKVMHF